MEHNDRIERSVGLHEADKEPDTATEGNHIDRMDENGENEGQSMTDGVKQEVIATDDVQRQITVEKEQTTPVAGTVDSCSENDTILEELLCPICLDTYRKPRTLKGCLHTFCEICLIEYISNAENGANTFQFKCPVCRIPTKGPEKKEQIPTWVQDLPVNHVINSLIGKNIKRLIDFQEIKYHCDPCRSQGMEKVARHFCVECDENFCQECVRYHKHLKQTRNHNLVSYDDIDNDPKQAINITTSLKCVIHPEKDIEFYCKDENTLCCISCATVRHRSCGNVLEITQLGGELDDSEMALAAMNELKWTADIMNDLTRKTEDNLDKDLKKVKSDFQKFKEDMLQKLQSLEKQMEKKCTAYEIGTASSNTDLLARHNGLTSAITTSAKQLENVMAHGNPVQKFVTLHRTWDQIKEYKNIIINNTKHLNSQAIELELNDLSSAFLGSNTLAEVNIREQPLGAMFLIDKLKKCQNDVYLMKVRWTKMKLVALQKFVDKKKMTQTHET